MDVYINLLPGVLIYILGIISPGPSNLAIVHTSIHGGRKAGILFAMGIISGSFFWGVLAASGLQPILKEYESFLYILKVLGGLYFLYLAYKSFSMVVKKDNKKSFAIYKDVSNIKYFLSGLMMHLLNPKVIAVWVAIITATLSPATRNISVFLLVGLCLPFGVVGFITYAFVFSNERVVNKYLNYKIFIDSFVGVTFLLVGCKLLFDANK